MKLIVAAEIDSDADEFQLMEFVESHPEYVDCLLTLMSLESDLAIKIKAVNPDFTEDNVHHETSDLIEAIKARLTGT